MQHVNHWHFCFWPLWIIHLHLCKQLISIFSHCISHLNNFISIFPYNYKPWNSLELNFPHHIRMQIVHGNICKKIPMHLWHLEFKIVLGYIDLKIMCSIFWHKFSSRTNQNSKCAKWKQMTAHFVWEVSKCKSFLYMFWGCTFQVPWQEN